jgi:hypothetical protein
VKAHCRSLGLPNFLLVLVALASFMRFSPTENRTRGCVSSSVAGNSACARDDKGEGRDLYQEPSDRMDRKKQQVPPLRFAPVGMTISFKLENFALKIYKVTASQDDDSWEF